MLGNFFSRSIFVLAGGTAISRGAMLLALPILTRVYSPEDFGAFAIFTAVLGVLAVVACLRFEIAIPIPAKAGEAANLLMLALLSSVLVASITAVVVFFFSEPIASATGAEVIREYFWLWPLGVLLAGTYNGLQYWATRRKQFETIARTRVVQGVGGALSQVGLGLLGIAPLGLIVGYLVSVSAGILSLARAAYGRGRKILGSISVARMRQALIDYQRFPKYGTPEALMNTAGAQLPIVLVASSAGIAEAGFLLLTVRVIGTPMGMVGAAFGQVYHSSAPRENRRGAINDFTHDVLGKLVKTGVGPLLFAAIVAEPLFVFAFGGEWSRAGQLLPWLTPWFVMQFLSSPVSPLMQVLGLQRTMAFIVFVGLILRIGAVVVAMKFVPTHIPEFFGFGSFLYYAILFAFVYRVAGLDGKRIAHAIWTGAPIVLLWITVGVALRVGLKLVGS